MSTTALERSATKILPLKEVENETARSKLSNRFVEGMCMVPSKANSPALGAICGLANQD